MNDFSSEIGPKTTEIERVPSLRIGFLGRDAGFLRVELENQMGQNEIPSMYELDYADLKKRIKLHERNQSMPRIVVTDNISPKETEELNSWGISIIFLDQTHRDHSYLTSDNTQRTVKNEIIPVEPNDWKTPGDLVTKLAETIKNITQ